MASIDGGPLDGIKVVEVAQLVSGPYCGMLLAEQGAHVTKVEPPQGDMARQFGPFVDSGSAYFEAVNRGKEFIRCDLRSAEDRAHLDGLIAEADVFITNMRVSAAARVGLDLDTLRAKHPSLVVCSISAYDSRGGRSSDVGVDLIFQAESGLMDITGYADGFPTRVGTNVPDFYAAMSAFSGTMSALFQRQRTGTAPLVEVSLLGAAMSMQTCWMAAHSAGPGLARMGNGSPFSSPTGMFSTADGWLVISIVNDAHFAKFCDALGLPGLAEDEHFATNDARCRHRHHLEATIQPALLQRSAEGWVKLLRSRGLPAARPTSYDDILRAESDMIDWQGDIALAPPPFRIVAVR